MPTITARYDLTADGYSLGSWAKCEGLEVNWDVAPRPAGTSRTFTLTRPRGADAKLQTWYRSAQSGTASRKSCTLVMYDTQGAPVARYHLTNAWPSKIEVGSLKAGDSAQLMETVTIVSERIQRVSV